MQHLLESCGTAASKRLRIMTAISIVKYTTTKINSNANVTKIHQQERLFVLCERYRT